MIRWPTHEDRIHGVRARVPLETRVNDFTRVLDDPDSSLRLYSQNQKARGAVEEILRVPLRMIPLGMSPAMECCTKRTKDGCDIHDWYRVYDRDPDGWWFIHNIVRIEVPKIVTAVEFLLTASEGHYSVIPRAYFDKTSDVLQGRIARPVDSRETFITTMHFSREQCRQMANPDCAICLGTGVIEHVEPKVCDCCWRNA